MKLSEKLRLLLERNAWTQARLANELHVVPSTVQKWVVGKNIPPAEVFLELSRIFHVPIENLLNDDMEIPETNEIAWQEEYNPFDIPLASGAKLHRFVNLAGDACSAIYLNQEEIWWHYREHELKMIRAWNEAYKE